MDSSLKIENLSGFGGGVSEIRQQNQQKRASVGEAKDGMTFSSMLRKAVDDANTYQHQADLAIREMVAGKNKNIHETMLALERADMSLKLMVQVRNKVLDAYREIMRMQV